MTYRGERKTLYQASERRLQSALQTLAIRLGQDLRDAAGPDGLLDPAQMASLRQKMADRILLFVLGREMLPFGAGGVPHSELAILIRQAVEAITLLAVQVHRRPLEQTLSPTDLRTARQATQRPASRPDPYYRRRLNGLDLTDRLWRVAIGLRERTLLLVQAEHDQGQTAAQIAATLLVFIDPQQRLRGQRIYGTNVGYLAARLSRVEMSTAEREAALVAAASNPLVTMVSVRRTSDTAPCTTNICNEIRDGSPYPLASVPLHPYHPECLCYYVFEMNGDRQALAGQDWNVLNPLSAQFVSWLLGRDELLDTSVRVA